MKWLFLSAVFLLLPFGGVLAQVDLQDENTRATQPPPSFIEPGSGVPVVKTTPNTGNGAVVNPVTTTNGTVDPVTTSNGTVNPVTTADATNGGNRQSVSIENPLKAKDITQFFTSIIQVILIFATPLVVLFIILAGFKYVVARGNPEKIKEANNALLFAVIGGLLILGAFAILAVIQGTVDAFLK